MCPCFPSPCKRELHRRAALPGLVRQRLASRQSVWMVLCVRVVQPGEVPVLPLADCENKRQGL